MNKHLLLLCFLVLFFSAKAQENGFAFGQISLPDLQMKVYPRDSTAHAVVLQEFGESRIGNENDFNLLHDYHIKIKILSSQVLNRLIFRFLFTNSPAKRSAYLKFRLLLLT